MNGGRRQYGSRGPAGSRDEHAPQHLPLAPLAKLQAKTVAARHAVEVRECEWEHCSACGEETEQYAVYWYAKPWHYSPPLRAIDGTEIRSVLAKVFVQWCRKHQGDPPLRYTEQAIPAGGLP